MEVKFRKDCNFQEKKYIANEKLEITKENYYDIWRLNERGFIYPIDHKEYIKLEKKLNKVGEINV